MIPSVINAYQSHQDLCGDCYGRRCPRVGLGITHQYTAPTQSLVDILAVQCMTRTGHRYLCIIHMYMYLWTVDIISNNYSARLLLFYLETAMVKMSYFECFCRLTVLSTIIL